MRQNSSSTVSNSSIPQILHPVLEAALDSLDVELEEELTRYRRQKHRLSRQVGQKQHVQTWQPSKPSIGGAKHAVPLQLPLEHGSSLNQASLNQASPKRIGSSAVASADLKTLAAMSSAALNSANVGTSAVREPVIGQAAIGQPIPRQPNAPQKTVHKSRMSNPRTDDTANTRQSVNGNQSVAPDPWLKGDLAIASPDSSQNQELLHQDQDIELNSIATGRWNGLDGVDRDESALMAISPGLEEDVWLQSSSDSDDENPEGYLESTEELLKSIAEETPEVRSEQHSTSLLDSLLTPLGIGSMLLLLLSSATLGFVIMNPSSLDFLTAREQAADPGVSASTAGNSNTTSSTSKIPDSPNLAAEEFVDLNLDTLSTLPEASAGRSPNPGLPSSPSAIAPPSGVSAQGLASQSGASQSESSESANIAAAPAIPPTVPVEAAPDPYVPPEPAAPEPYYPPAADPYIPPPAETASPAETAPADVATAPAANSAPSGNYYYVVTPYSGDPSLENAREAVPDAYVRNFDNGATVQLGAFSDPTKAEELLQQLQEQGIPAEVYHP